jgi:sigma-B regulation protein RsbU (phosphoserine phosphatase)
MPRILIVEDEPDIALGLQVDLTHEGYDVEIVRDGEAALERAARGALDLILLDVMLPRKDGFTVCRELRRWDTQTPIVVLTARAHELEKIRGLELGADDYVTKPFSPIELRARIKSILAHRKAWRADGVRLDRELRTAADVQQRLLPQTRPSITSLDYVGYCQPALLVGGDYYDFLDLSDDHVGLVVADVSGKGASAALVMASLHGCLRAHANGHTGRFEEVITTANTLLHAATDAGRYATVFYGVYSGADRQLRYVNAGHPAALVARDGDLWELESDCPPLGLFERIEPVPRRIRLSAGDRLLVFSDGLSEAVSTEGVEFGAEAARVLADRRLGTADELRQALLAALHTHTGGRQADDVTLITGMVR